MIRLTANSNTCDSVLDAYFAAVSLDQGTRYDIAIEVWRTLSPDEKLVLQNTARKLAGSNLELGSEHTRSLLLLKYLESRITTQASADPKVTVLEA